MRSALKLSKRTITLVSPVVGPLAGSIPFIRMLKLSSDLMERINIKKKMNWILIFFIFMFNYK
jgi:hypothetical protein